MTTRYQITANKGFTLIELISTLVLVGVLAATALPKYQDLSTEARIATLQQVRASIEVAATNAYLLASIEGEHEKERSTNVDYEGLPMELKYGYPEARAESRAGITDLISTSDNLATCFSKSCISGNSSRVKIGFDTTEGSGCYVRYSEPGGTGAPSETQYGLIVVTVGC